MDIKGDKVKAGRRNTCDTHALIATSNYNSYEVYHS